MNATDWISKLKRTRGLQWVPGWTSAKHPLPVREQTSYWGNSRKVASLSEKSSPSYLIIPSYPNLLFCRDFPLENMRATVMPAAMGSWWRTDKIFRQKFRFECWWEPFTVTHTAHCASCKYTGGINLSWYEAHYDLSSWMEKTIFITSLSLTHSGDFNSTNTWEDHWSD